MHVFSGHAHLNGSKCTRSITCLSIFLSNLSIYLPIYLSADLSICRSTYLPLTIYVCMHLTDRSVPIYLSIYLLTYLPVYLQVSTVYQPIYLSIYLPVYLSSLP